MKTWYSLLVSLLLSSSIVPPIKAQITIDGTTNTILTPMDNGIRIDEGDRAGGNLFHSFEQFSLVNGSEAFFNNANDIVNIFSRVTGGNISNIDGLLRANGAANLFLLNPAGIIFGENARLDIGGSFFASTADSIIFPDEIEFSASDAQTKPLLTIKGPIGLDLGDNPGEITVRGDGLGTRFTNDLIDTEDALRVNSSSTLGLVGGNLNLKGATLKTAGGRIELGSVAGNEQVSLTPIEEGFSLGYEGVANFGDINLSQSAAVDATGLLSGDIQVWGNNISLTENSSIEASTLGNIPNQEIPGNIEITASDTITIESEFSDSSTSIVRSLVYPGTVGDGAGITITTGNLTLTDGGAVFARTAGEGDAGDVEITAHDTITMDGENGFFSTGVFSDVFRGAVGNGGQISITADNLALRAGGIVASGTLGEGDGGDIEITAHDTITIDSKNGGLFFTGISNRVLREAVGNSGKMTINTSNLILTNGGRIDASTSSQGNAGDVIVNATESIVISGINSEGNFTTRSGLFAQALIGNGNGGSVNVFTNQLTIDNDGSIDVGNFDDFAFLEPGTGEPGNINIEANALNLSNEASIVAATQAETGDNANINLRIAQGITLQDNSFISAQAFQNANGGNIDIETGFILAFPNSNSDILASAEQGQGGNINITAEALFGIEERPLNPFTNDINASSEFGLDGTININLLDTNPAEGIENLPRFVIDPDKLVVFSLCSLARDSEFYYTAKGGNAPNLAQVREEGVIAVDLVEPVTLEEEKQGSKGAEGAEEVEKEIVEAQGWIFHENGVVELVAYKTDVNGSPPQPKDPRICPK